MSISGIARTGQGLDISRTLRISVQFLFRLLTMVFENHRKSLIQHCERVDKKWSILASFREPEAYSQNVLPDRSILKGQKLVDA